MLIELDGLFRPIVIGILALRPLSVLFYDVGVGGIIEPPVFRFWDI